MSSDASQDGAARMRVTPELLAQLLGAPRCSKLVGTSWTPGGDLELTLRGPCLPAHGRLLELRSESHCCEECRSYHPSRRELI
jgi:hypothetical protein